MAVRFRVLDKTKSTGLGISTLTDKRKIRF